MKKIHYLLLAAIIFIAASCTKEYTAPIYTPEKNTWLVNTDTFGPANFTYYDTANLIYGGINKVGSITVLFKDRPQADGQYVLRQKADEVDEVTIIVVDSVKNISWKSTDDDGLAMKGEQFATITATKGGRVGVAFNNLFLKRTDNVDKAQISINIQ